MLVYWTMFIIPALSTLVVGRRQAVQNNRLGAGLAVVLLAFTLLIGLRFQVGTDWFNYARTLDRLSYVSLAGAMAYKDPGFGLLAWASTPLGYGYYGTNIFCGGVLILGLAKFITRQANPWMVLTAAVPYLIIVVGMGYVRQAAAIGFVLMALVALQERRLPALLGWLAAAALFHGSSLCVLPVIVLAIVRRQKALLIPLAVISAVLYFALLQQRLDVLYSLYVDREEARDSAGALVRLLMNTVPSLIYLYYGRVFVQDDLMRGVWLMFSLISLVLLVLVFLFPSSTVIDRLGLYFIPIQLFVFGNLSALATRTRIGETAVSYLIVVYYAAVLFVWLNYATNAQAWLPYRFAPWL